MARRVGQGSTLALALAAEECATVNVATWKKALQAHPEFSPHYDAGKGKFIDWATERLARSKNLQDLRWLLERRHPDLFARPAEQPSVVVNQSTSVSIPADVLERSREIARTEAVAVAVHHVETEK